MRSKIAEDLLIAASRSWGMGDFACTADVLKVEGIQVLI